MTLASSSDKFLLVNVVMIDGLISLPSKASTSTEQQNNINYFLLSFTWCNYFFAVEKGSVFFNSSKGGSLSSWGSLSGRPPHVNRIRL